MALGLPRRAKPEQYPPSSTQYAAQAEHGIGEERPGVPDTQHPLAQAPPQLQSPRTPAEGPSRDQSWGPAMTSWLCNPDKYLNLSVPVSPPVKDK